MIKKKQEQARRSRSEGHASDTETLPLEWAVENRLLVKGRLSESWRDIYWSFIHPYAGPLDKSYICQEYVKGFMWILDYYRGLPVDRAWMFPAWIPPLWSDLVGLRSDLAAFAQGSLCADLAAFAQDIQSELSIKESVTLKPQEQLAMVLPLESWGLIRDPALRRLPILAPQMWPKTFGFFSLGRKWLWECEALIPVLTAARVREILS
jgi:5'-3' exonuclease